MEPEISLQCPQKPDTYPYSEPDESSTHTHILFFKIKFNITPIFV
jgi:hypothetical protein